MLLLASGAAAQYKDFRQVASARLELFYVVVVSSQQMVLHSSQPVPVLQTADSVSVQPACACAAHCRQCRRPSQPVPVLQAEMEPDAAGHRGRHARGQEPPHPGQGQPRLAQGAPSLLCELLSEQAEWLSCSAVCKCTSGLPPLPGWQSVLRRDQGESGVLVQGKPMAHAYGQRQAALQSSFGGPTAVQSVFKPERRRVLMQGVRTLVASNEQPSEQQVEEGRTFNETWTWWPDDVPQRSMCAFGAVVLFDLAST